MAAPKKINLLVQEDFEHTPAGKILGWALSFGRIIVIVTELVVISAFLWRFWLDKKIFDLGSENLTLQAQIEASSGFEEQFRSAQKRLAGYQELTKSQTNFVDEVSGVAALLPSEVSLESFLFQEGELILRGQALSEGGLLGFIKNLTASGKFSEVNLSEVSLGSEVSQNLNFTVKTKR